MDSLPIGEYALLSDCRSAALVSRDGSVDWLCFPRFDGPSVFCRLLDPPAGHFAIRPAGEFQVSRRYVDQTLVLETTFTTADGTAVLTDALAVGRNERGHQLGAQSPTRCCAGWPASRRDPGGGQLRSPAGVRPHPPVLVPVPGGLRPGRRRRAVPVVGQFGVRGATATARVTAGRRAGRRVRARHTDMAGPPLVPWTAE